MNYDKFKTPFFKISIADPNNNRSVDLPDFILGLIERIEIQDSISENDYNTINIKFVEGSREPAKNDFNTDKGLYNIDKAIEGSITNRIGALADLRFSGFAGITFTTEQEIQTGSVEEDRRFRNNIVFEEPKKVRLLFDSRNQIAVTWGYLEDKDSVRTIRGRIISTKADFPDRSQPTLTIIATSAKLFMDMETPLNGIPLRVEKKLNSTIVPEYEDRPTGELLKEISEKIGLNFIISDDFLNSKSEKHVNKLIVGGQSFKQFLDNLASSNNAYWDIILDPKTGKDTLIFMAKKDFESRTVFDDSTLLTYKGPNSILKTVNITTDFGMFTGSGKVGLDSEGNSLDIAQDNGKSTLRIYKPLLETENQGKLEKVINNKPSQDIEANRRLLNDVYNRPLGTETLFSAGNVEVSPNKTETLEEDAQIEAENLNRTIAINFVSLGFTRFVPGVYEIGGIGTRYSGKYRILTVKHVIDNSGYSTTCSGGTFADPSGALDLPEGASKGMEKGKSKIQVLPPLKKQDTSIPSRERDSGIQKRDEYEKLVYKK